MTLRGSLSVACDFSLQRIGYVILSNFPQDDSEILEIKGNPHTTEKNKKVRADSVHLLGHALWEGLYGWNSTLVKTCHPLHSLYNTGAKHCCHSYMVKKTRNNTQHLYAAAGFSYKLVNVI